MGKQKSTDQFSEDDDYTPGCEGKRPYQFVSDTKKQKLIELAVQNAVKVNRASRKVRVNNSNAKVIIRKQREKRIQAVNQGKLPDLKPFVKIESLPKHQQDLNLPQIVPQLNPMNQYYLNYYIVSPFQFFPMNFR